MELAGLKVVMDADLSSVYSEFSKGEQIAKQFANNIKGLFSAIPDLGKKLTFTTNGASQAVQNMREMARAERESAIASRELARAKEIEERTRRANEKAVKRELDDYGKLVKESNDLVRAYYNASAQILKMGDSAGITAQELENMRQKALEGQQVLQKIEQGVGRFQRNVGNYASGFNPLTNSINQLTREMPAFAHTMQTGFMAISNNIPALFDALDGIKRRNAELIAQGKPAESMFKQLATSIFSWQTALSVGVTLLTIYGADMIKYITNSKASTEAKKREKKAQDDLNNSISSANSSYAQQVGQLRSLQAVVMSTTASKEQQASAYKELQKLYPSYLNNMSLEQAQAGGLAKVINNELIPALVASAKARVITSEIENSYKRERELVKQLTKSMTDLHNAQKEYNDAVKSTQGNITRRNQRLRNLNYIGSGGEVTKDIKEAKDAVEAIEKELFNTYTSSAKLQQQLSKIQGTLGSLNSSGTDLETLVGGSETGTQKAEKEIKTIDDAYQKLQDTLEVNKKLFLSNQIDLTKQLESDISAYRGYIQTLFETFKLDSDDVHIVEANIHIESYTKQLEWMRLEQERVKNGIAIFKSELDKLNKAYKEGQKRQADYQAGLSAIATKIELEMITSTQGLEERIKHMNNELERLVSIGDKDGAKKLWDDIKGLNNELSNLKTSASIDEALNNMINGAIQGGSVALGEGIANALTGRTGLEGVFQSVLSTIGQQIQEFGKQIIAIGVAMLKIKESLKTLFNNPWGAIIAGTGAVILGRLLQNAGNRAGSRVGRNFADGGMVYGETFARVGEYTNARGNPEIIAPLDKLTSVLKSVGFGNNQTQVFIPQAVIRGEDIRLSYIRADKRFNR